MGKPVLLAYHASKWALEGMLSSLSQEVEKLGIKVTAIEPGAFVQNMHKKMIGYARVGILAEVYDYKNKLENHQKIFYIIQKYSH